MVSNVRLNNNNTEMDLNKQQAYEAYMRKASEIVINWHNLKPDNKDIKHLLDCLAAVANYVNDLNKEIRTVKYVSDEKLNKFREISEILKEKFGACL